MCRRDDAQAPPPPLDVVEGEMSCDRRESDRAGDADAAAAVGAGGRIPPQRGTVTTGRDRNMLWKTLTGLDLRAGLRRAGGSSSACPAGARVGDVNSGEGGRRRMVSTDDMDDMDDVNSDLLRSGSTAALAIVSAGGESNRRFRGT